MIKAACLMIESLFLGAIHRFIDHRRLQLQLPHIVTLKRTVQGPVGGFFEDHSHDDGRVRLQ